LNLPEASLSEYRDSVIDEIYDIMLKTPQAIAVTDGDLEWTYDELRVRSETVASGLASHGITRGSVVGMHLPRCADAIAAMLGIMAAGCVYLPLDPSYPKGRLRYMLDQAEAAAIVSVTCDPDLYGSHRFWLPVQQRLSPGSNDPAGEPTAATAEREPFGPAEPAYVLFTSGSTGDPKGVMVTHRNLTLMNAWSAKVLGVTALDASATTCSLSFDASFHETVLPLSVGATVNVIPHALALGQLDRPVSLVATTPTVANELLRAGHLPSLRVLMLGGEVLAPDAATRLLSSGRVGRLFNCYGPTECTACVSLAEVTMPVPEVISIGWQVPGTEILILDPDGRRLPDTETGEICVFGGQLADGYVNDPAKTAERFTTGPSGAAEPRRYYRTGDLGYRAVDGALFFAGRADRQVKISGHRIELGEIDAALRSHPQVADAVTIAWDASRMVAYVVPEEPGAGVDTADLRAHLAKSLPRFMLPAGVVAVAELPKTVSGKLDTSALPAWSPGRPGRERSRSGDVDDMTARVIAIAADVTGFTGQIRPADDFIDDLGGTSLDIVRVLAELERHSGRRLRLSDALADTSVGGLASLLREAPVPSPADFAFNADGDAPPLFMIHAYLGGMLRLRRVAELLPPNQPVYGLQVYADGGPGSELTIAALAQGAVKRIRAIQPSGPVTLTAHSAGGLIAFEAAQTMVQAGDPEPRLLLMDSPRPAGVLGYFWGEQVLHLNETIYKVARHPLYVLGRLFKAIWPGESPALDAARDADLLTLTERQQQSTATAIQRYKARPYPGAVTLMRTRQGRVMALGRRHMGWASVTRGTVTLIDVPGSHIAMMEEPHLGVLTQKLIDWLYRE
jgi:nonribosomal peptide synthetase DhbF